jgi:nucleoside-diphosphate-sugar epimerase
MLLITGATGHTGQWLIKALVREGYEEKIRCSLQPTSRRELLDQSKLDIEYIVGDFRDPEFAFRALDGITTVIHLVGISCSRNVIAACRKHGVGWAILVHTTGRYSKFKSAAQEYIDNEDWILQTEVPCTFVRPTMIYGSSKDRNMWRLIDVLFRYKVFPIFGKGDNLMQPIHARDLGEALYGVLTHREKTFQCHYNVAGREPITYRELVKTIAKALNKNILLIRVPHFLCFWGAKLLSVVFKNPVISPEQVLRMKEDKVFDYSSATKDFGFSPMSFAEGIQEEVNAYLRQCRTDSNPL